jgi:secreted Zn-dependent insulinase-like peptidase
LSGDFLKPSFFESTKDRVIRGLRTFFESRRADSHAMYYRDALLASKDNGIEDSLAMAVAADFESIKEHHAQILRNNEVVIDCLFSGNVSAKEAKNFFSQTSTRIQEVQQAPSPTDIPMSKRVIPGKKRPRIH